MHLAQAFLALLTIGLAASQCLEGGLKNPNGQCIYPQYIEGCLQYSNIKNQCLQCESNYQKLNNICVYNAKSTTSDCCSKFNQESRCIQCSGGLIISQQTGLCVDQKIPGCIKKDQSSCVVCVRDYDLVGKRCIKSINNCLTYDSSNRCTSCQNNYILSNGVCIFRTEVSTIQYCHKANQFGCYECHQGYRPSNGLCAPVEFRGCLRYDNNGNCLRCEGPYYSLRSGKCTITGCLQYSGFLCKKCDSSLGFLLKSNRCQIPNCLYFGENGCTVCKNNLVAGSWGCRQGNDRVCIICKTDEYLSKDGNCLKKNVHCKQYKDGVCVSCINGYYFNVNGQCTLKKFGCIYSNGRCQSCQRPFSVANQACTIQGCLAYDENGCTKCHSKLVLDDSVCKIPSCQSFNSDYVCTRCTQGYQLNSNNQCIQVDPFCERRNSFNNCIQCKTNYNLNAYGRCVSIKIGCNYVDGRCTSCRAPFIYVPQSESCFIDGCLDYFVGGCSKCQVGYSLLYNSCKLPNCLISNKGKCDQCDPDFVFNSKGLCVNKDEFCDEMDQNGVCAKCMPTYHYSIKLQKCVKKAQGCIYNNQDQCYACEPPFTFDNGRCTINGCITYSRTGCSQCQYPYSLSKEKTCFIANCAKITNNVCVQCKEGFILDDKKLCRVSDKNCVEFDEDRTMCTRCIKGYRLDENNRCQYSDEYCNYFDRYGICTNCDRLYFTNSLGKCQLRDPQCITYTNGYCSKCKPYHFPNNGICFANLKGCSQQKSYGDCRKCDKGYELDNGVCKAQITNLNWNSVDMDFFQDGDKQSAEVFSYNMTNKLSLVQAIAVGKASVFYSSSSLNNANFPIDSEDGNGWSPLENDAVDFIGIQTATVQTFYAFEIKPLTGCQQVSFNIEYSFDGISYNVLEKYTLTNFIIGVAKTYYIKPVEAKFMRLVFPRSSRKVHIKIQFYYSNTTYQVSSISTKTYISKTVAQTIDGIDGGISSCQDSKLCWAGVQTCEPTKLRGFQLIYTNDAAQNNVSEIKIDYSLDGTKFTCYDNCKPKALTNRKYEFEQPILAEKVHVHFVKYQGNPKFGIKFNWE